MFDMRSSVSDIRCCKSALTLVRSESCFLSSSLRSTNARETAAAAWLTTPSSSSSSSSYSSSSPLTFPSNFISATKLRLGLAFTGEVPFTAPPLIANAPMAYIRTASCVLCSAPLDIKSSDDCNEAHSAFFFRRSVSSVEILVCNRDSSARYPGVADVKLILVGVDVTFVVVGEVTEISSLSSFGPF